MQQRVDAAVVGGGPAGALSALLLARLGWQVLLIERGERGRDKCCGHCLGPRAIAAMEQLGLLPKVSRIARGRMSEFTVNAPAGAITVRLAGPKRARAGWLVDRGEFDQLLRDAACDAGVTLMQPATARARVTFGAPAAVAVRAQNQEAQQVECGLIVGADGLGSGVARATGLACHPRAGRRYGFSFRWEPPGGSRDLITAGLRQGGRVSMFLERSGYLGVAPAGDRLHVAVMGRLQGDAAHDPVAIVRRISRQHVQLCRLGLDRAERHQLQGLLAAGPMSWRPGRIANRFAALVGDAAGYAEPFTGEGMTWAIVSAQALAGAASGVKPGRWSGDAANVYRAAWRKAVGRRLGICRALGIVLASPSVWPWCMRAARAWPGTPRWIAAQVAQA